MGPPPRSLLPDNRAATRHGAKPRPLDDVSRQASASTLPYFRMQGPPKRRAWKFVSRMESRPRLSYLSSTALEPCESARRWQASARLHANESKRVNTGDVLTIHPLIGVHMKSILANVLAASSLLARVLAAVRIACKPVRSSSRTRKGGRVAPHPLFVDSNYGAPSCNSSPSPARVPTFTAMPI
jgi:hypothetical protein